MDNLSLFSVKRPNNLHTITLDGKNSLIQSLPIPLLGISIIGKPTGPAIEDTGIKVPIKT